MSRTLSVNEWNPLAIRINTIQNKSESPIKKFRLTSEQTNGALMIQTPKMHTWGIQEFIDKKTNIGDGKFKLSLNFPMEKNAETDMFKEKIETFHKKVIDLIETNSVSFFNKKKSRDVIEETTFPILKYSKIKESNEYDYSKPPSLSIKIDNIYDQLNKKYTDELNVNVYNKDTRLIYPNDDPNDSAINHVTKSSIVIAIIKCTSIWFGQTNWGISFSADQIVVLSQGDSITSNICKIKFNEYDDNEENDDENIKESKPIIEQKPTVISTINVAKHSDTFIEDDDDDIVQDVKQVDTPVDKPVVDDDDDDDDDDDEPAPPKPEPVKPVIQEAPKKIVKRVIKK
jgi:hypothetical protein